MTSGPMASPMSGLGRLQGDVIRLESEVRRKANEHEIHSINSRVDSVAASVREVGSVCSGILDRLQACEEKFQRLEHPEAVLEEHGIVA